MGFGTKRARRMRHKRAMALTASAFLSGMRIEKHRTSAHSWDGPGPICFSADIDGVLVYRISLAALARVFLLITEEQRQEHIKKYEKGEAA